MNRLQELQAKDRALVRERAELERGRYVPAARGVPSSTSAELYAVLNRIVVQALNGS